VLLALKILADPELRVLLMDKELQSILQDCSHPGKLQRYMSDPVVSKKIRRLAECGLVQLQV
jgi:hypothetical protein